MSLLDSILGAAGICGPQIYGRCIQCGASSRALPRDDGSWGPVHYSHCQFIRKLEESRPMSMDHHLPPLESIPGPNGCPAAHLLTSEREAFGKASKEQIAALWRISELVQEHMTDIDIEHYELDLVLYRRLVAICAWALGNTRQLKDPADVAVLVEPSSEAPPSRGTPS